MVVESVDQSKFKTCNDLSFCKRNRELSGFSTEEIQKLQHIILEKSVKLTKEGVIEAELVPKSDHSQPLLLEITAYDDNIVRFRVKEKVPLPNRSRYEVRDVLLPGVKPTPITWMEPLSKGGNQFSFKFGEAYAKVQLAPFRFDVYVNGDLAVSSNRRDLFHFEHMSEKPQPPQPQPQQPAENNETNNDTPPPPQPELYKEGTWEERFQSHQDSKPYGPMSVGLDFSFIGSKHVYGIPEHSTSLALRSTRGEGINENPYRLYNLDVFEYELDKTMALYGSIPFLLSHDSKKTVGLFWLNAAETFIDVEDSKDSNGSPVKDTHWFSETGVMDVFILAGPTPARLFKQYGYLTGTTALPQMFSLGYHQCRWNYKDEADVKAVDQGFDQFNIPYDVIWLDIEHTDGKRYFTWDKSNFPTPENMLKNIESKHRKMVVIVDPHIKRDPNYYIHSEATDKGLYVKKATGGNDYEGWCWPGSSSYLDFTNPTVRDWWASQFAYDKFKGSSPILYIWNDMNEPSVFDGPEVSMHKDALHFENREHRDIHNLYGYYYHMATAEGLVQRNKDHNDRPFVLSRAFFAGSQRIGAIWTGDNAAQWSHLEASNPMLLSLNLAGISFSGADVGGFFGNPSAELLTRWYQAGAFQPFFRGHAHLDARRREPWLFGDPYLSIIRSAIVTRYSYLPYWYTTFFQNNQTGLPVLRPMWVEFPENEALYSTDDQFMVGSALLVRPVTHEGQKSVKVVLPGGPNSKTQWFDVETSKKYQASTIDMETPLEKIPVFQRGGTIIPKKERVRRSSDQMKTDPYTLRIALDSNQQAYGELYVDDEHTFDYQKGSYLYKSFTYKDQSLTMSDISGNSKFKNSNVIERIVILGLDKTPSKVEVDGKSLGFEFDKTTNSLTIRKPDLPISSNWKLNIRFKLN
eukprot:gene8341-10246_t